MKIFIKLSVLFVIICTFATQNNYTYSQTEFAPIGAQWYYKDIDAILPGVFKYSGIQFTSEKDSIVEGKICRIIRGNYLKNGAIPYYEIIYEENGIVYYYFNNQFRKIYDFTVQEGDTIDFEFKSNMRNSRYLDTSIIVPCIVEKISIDTIDNIAIKTFHTRVQRYEENFDFEWPIYHTYSEKFGKTFVDFHFCFFLVITNFITIPEVPYYVMNCYNDAAISYMANWWQSENKPCGFLGTVTSIKEKENISNPIQIFPNPAQDKLNIQFAENFNTEQITIAVYDIMGKIVFEKEYLSESLISVDVQNLIAGCYFLKINNNNIVLTNKFIKL